MIRRPTSLGLLSALFPHEYSQRLVVRGAGEAAFGDEAGGGYVKGVMRWDVQCNRDAAEVGDFVCGAFFEESEPSPKRLHLAGQSHSGFTRLAAHRARS
jgi:hypothetical protein